MAVVDSLLANWPTLLGIVLVGSLVYWLVDEYRKSGSPSDAILGTGERADRVTGELIGSFGAIVAAIFMIGMTIGQQLLETASLIEPFVSSAPVVIGHLVIAALGYLTIDGVLGWNASDYGMAVVVVTIVVLFLRYYGGD